MGNLGRNAVAALLALAVGVAGAAAGFAAGTDVRQPTGPQQRAAVLAEHSFGCVVTLRSTGPALLNDAAHHCAPEFTGVSVDASGLLVVTYDPVLEIVTASVDADESLILNPRQAVPGASVGLGEARVRFTQNGVQVHPNSASVACTSCNIFVRIWGMVEVEVPA